MKVLITGGAGFIGSHLAENLQKQGYEIVIFDDLSTGNINNLKGLNNKAEFFFDSILDRAKVAKAMKGVDYVFHLAARTSVPQSMTAPLDYIHTNVVGLLGVLEEAVTAGVKKLVFASSSAVYGGSRRRRQSELDQAKPKSPYSVTKLDGEHYCQIFSEITSLKTVSLRFFNVYGPRQDPNSSYSAAIPIFVRQALANQPLTIYGDGYQTRDFTYVEDVASACVFAATKHKMKGVYNVGAGNSVAIRHIANQVIEIAGSSSKIEYAPARIGDVKYSCANFYKLSAEGFVVRAPLGLGLKKTLDYYKSLP
jgi:UDP-glucose 4-epimerase